MPPQVQLAIDTTPSHAEVYEGDVLIATTPLTLSRAQGTGLELTFKVKGFVSVTRSLSFDTDGTVSLTLDKAAVRKVAAARPKPAAADLKDLPF